VHEHALMQDIVRKLEAVSEAEGGGRVVRVGVRLGALSHFTEPHFLEHFADATRGTCADGAAVEAVVETDTTAPHAQGVLVETVEVATG
jgi:hydrogenase nickel incorporation protein HypA/HybF